MTGLFVVFEGGDGVGKSTQVDLLAEWLAEQGYEVIRTHEPGGSPIGPDVRRLARLLGVRFSQRVLLERVARAAGLPSTGSLLISRGCFDAAVGRYALRRGERERLRVIRRMLFE